MSDCVVVIRTNQGDEVLAILNGEENGVVKIEHPYYVKYSSSANGIAMIPYCALSDERYFEFRRSDIQFLVTANREISQKFIRMVDARERLEAEQARDFLEEEQPYDEMEARLREKTFIEGNDTKH